jgi:hypothetical protein
MKPANHGRKRSEGQQKLKDENGKMKMGQTTGS